MNKIVNFMEKMWLVLSLLTFLIALYFTYLEVIYDALYFFGFSAVSILLFLMRRKQRLINQQSASTKKKEK